MKKLASVLIICLAIVHSGYARTFENIAGNYTGLVQSTDGDVASAGLASLDVLSTARFTGFVAISGYRISLKGSFGADSSTGGFTGTIAEFVGPEGTTTFVMRASLDINQRLITGSIDTNFPGDRFASTPFILSGQEPDADVDQALKGRQLTALIDPPLSGASQEIPGDGFAAVTVGKGKRRSVRYVGQLPDAERYSVGGYLHGRKFFLFSILYPPRILIRFVDLGGILQRPRPPVFARVVAGPSFFLGGHGITTIPLFKIGGHVEIDRSPESAGVIIGTVEAGVAEDGEPTLSSPVAWKKRPEASGNYYPDGFDVMVSVNASAYPRGNHKGSPLDIDKDVPGNISVKLRRGNLSEEIEVILDMRYVVPRVLKTTGSPQSNPHHFKLRIDRFHGTFSGKFEHPGSGERTPFRGAFLAKSDVSAGEGRGSFRGSVSAINTALPESGSVRIAPRYQRGNPF